MSKATPWLTLIVLLLSGSVGAQPTERIQTPTALDHTGHTVLARSGAALARNDLSEQEADRTQTQRIRQAVGADEALSPTAKNILISTINGVVTLRGSVSNIQEKARIEAIAQYIAGTDQVKSHLKVIGQ
jgi:hyperosmotically inducible protein